MEAGFGTKTTTPTEVTGMAEVGNMPTPAVLDVQKATFDQTVWNFVKQIWRSEASTLWPSARACNDHGCDLDSGFGQLPSGLRSVLIDAQSLTQLRTRRALNGGTAMVFMQQYMQQLLFEQGQRAYYIHDALCCTLSGFLQNAAAAAVQIWNRAQVERLLL